MHVVRILFFMAGIIAGTISAGTAKIGQMVGTSAPEALVVTR